MVDEDLVVLRGEAQSAHQVVEGKGFLSRDRAVAVLVDEGEGALTKGDCFAEIRDSVQDVVDLTAIEMAIVVNVVESELFEDLCGGDIRQDKLGDSQKVSLRDGSPFDRLKNGQKSLEVVWLISSIRETLWGTEEVKVDDQDSASLITSNDSILVYIIRVEVILSGTSISETEIASSSLDIIQEHKVVLIRVKDSPVLN